MSDKEEKVILTKEGLEELEQELERRKTEDREKIANDIEIAREQGDLSENAAYTSAMEAKSFNEARIGQIEEIIKNAVIEKGSTKDNKVGIGEKFVLERKSDKKKIPYILVGSNEADPQEGKISLESPIGKEVNGKKYGDEITVNLPTGEVEYKILKK